MDEKEKYSMRTDFQTVLVEQDESVVILTMNRPDVLNAISALLLQELIEAVEAAAHDDMIRCVVLTGAGRAFGAGQDLTEFGSAHASGETHLVSEQLPKYHRLISAILHMPKPVIAAIQGVATGITLNIALACDMRVAAENARLGEGFARIGLGRALEMALLAEDISGAEAERIGLVNRCVPLAELDRTTRALAKRLANGPTRTYQLIKELMYRSLDMDLQASLHLEGQLQEAAYTTADHREGVDAFLHKRAATFTGT